MKLVAKLKGFKDYSDLKATLSNKKGNQILDTITHTGDFNGRFVFRFEKGELPGKRKRKKASLKITLESLNDSNEANLFTGGEEFTFSPLKQFKRFRLAKKKKNSSRSFFTQGTLITQETTGPVFTSPTSVDSITEGSTSGTAIYLAAATGNNTPLIYSLTGQDANFLAINPNNGEVAIMENTDHGAKSSYLFNIIATDSEGHSTTSSPLTLSINKDLPPSFTSPITVTPIKEDSPLGSIIYNASATDNSGEVTFSLSGTDAASFKIDATSGAVSTQDDFNIASKDSYSFTVVATESGDKKQQTSLPLTLNITKAGATLTKIVRKDILPPETTTFSDSISCEIGTINNDTIQDPSPSDKDTIVIKSNQFNKLDSIFTAFGAKFINIEDFKIEASNDGSAELDLSGIANGKSFIFSPSTFTAATTYQNWGTPGIANYDFSEIRSQHGINLNNADSGLPTNRDRIKIEGTLGPDTVEGLSGDSHLLGGPGIDNLRGSTAGQSTIAGGTGQDIITFPNQNVQNTIDLTGQTTTTSRDTITGYVGANAATKQAGSFDLIQINDGAFPNYTAGATVQQKTIIEAGASPSMANILIVGLDAEIKSQVFPTGNQGLLAFATDTSKLVYAPAGNFTANTQELLQLDSNIFSAPDQIKVIDA